MAIAFQPIDRVSCACTNRRRFVRVALLTVGALFATPAGAQVLRTVRGVVADSAGLPLRYTNINAGSTLTIANDSGRFALELGSAGPVTLEVRRLGYQPLVLRLPAGGDTSLTITMSPYAQRLSGVTVIADRVRSLELRGFYERLEHRRKWGGSAQFITPEEVERRRSGRTTQLLEGLLSVKLVRGPMCAVSTFTCWIAVGHGNCIMTTYIDGIRLRPAGRYDPLRADRLKPVYIDEYVPMDHVSAIEVYQRPTQAPAEYQADTGNCGVILIWTK